MQISNVHIHFGQFDPAAAAAITGILTRTEAKALDHGPPKAATRPPPIGTYWQGQGGIYAGMGRGRDGFPDHHLIVANAPKKFITQRRMLGTYDVDVKGAESDHNGLANTIALADAGSELCKEIRELEIEGLTDFYLMSRTDARLCMANVPELFEKDWYLTSTQSSEGTAWTQHFNNGCQLNGSKKFEGLFRPVRRLIL